MFVLTTRKVPMKKNTLIIVMSYFYFSIVVSCATKNQTKRNHVLPNSAYVNPSHPSVDWSKLHAQSDSPNVKTFLKFSKATQSKIKEQHIPYSWKGISENWDYHYFMSKDKYTFMRKNGVDCTRFLRHIFLEEMKLPYNSKEKNYPILSHSFSQNRSSSELKNFIPIKKLRNGFKPKTGDILAFPGHALVVIDAKNCIALQSASWLCKKFALNSCYQSASGKHAGVTLYKLMNKTDCDNGTWKQLDAAKNKFTAAWRHKSFNTWIESMPHKAKPHQTITLIGYNISRRHIYFSGSVTPVLTSYAHDHKHNEQGDLLDIVTVKVPSTAKSGKLKIYWGNHLKPDNKHTVSSQTIINIEQQLLTKNNKL